MSTKRGQPHGVLDLDYSEISFPLFIEDCIVDSPITMEYAEFVTISLARSKLSCVSMDGARGRHDLILRGATIEGELRAIGAKFEGFDGEGARFENRGGDAISLDGVRLSGDLHLLDARIQGACRVLGGRIEGDATFTGALAQNDSGRCLQMDRCSIRGGIFLNDAMLKGEVHLIGVNVGGGLFASGSQFSNASAQSVTADGATCHGDMNLADSLFSGGIRVPGVSIQGDLVLRGAEVRITVDDAFAANDAEISGNIFLNNAALHGPVRVDRTTVGQSLDLTDTIIDGPGAPNLCLDDMRASSIEMCPGNPDEITVSLVNTNVGTIHTADEARLADLPRVHSAEGIRIETLAGAIGTRRKVVAAWLDTVPKVPGRFVERPWYAVAHAYARSGNLTDARWMYYQSARRANRSKQLWRRPLGVIYSLTVGYGYYPLRAAFLLAVSYIFTLATAFSSMNLFRLADPGGGPTSADPSATLCYASPAEAGCFNPVLYALDVVLPVANTGQRAMWQIDPSSWQAVAITAAGVSGWVLAALLVAGLTGLLRKAKVE